MAIPGTKARPQGSRNALASVIVAVVAFTVVAYFWPKPVQPELADMSPAAMLGAQTRPDVKDAQAAAPASPSFDVVRIGPRGDAVIAGRATPGAEIVVRDSGVEIARTRADRRGNFVAIPDAPLAPGGRELTLTARNEAGLEVKGDGSVVLEVPQYQQTSVAAGQPQAPLGAVLVPNAGSPRILQDAARPANGASRLTLDTVDYDDAGAIRFTGAAPAGGMLRLYVDNAAAGDVHADASGRWSLTPAKQVASGLHTVRVDQLDARGKVMARLELPFQRAAVQAADFAGGKVVVQPGQNLWRIARLAYGHGVQYRVIYLANHDQIRDPQRIYPGQTFAVPPT